MFGIDIGLFLIAAGISSAVLVFLIIEISQENPVH